MISVETDDATLVTAHGAKLNGKLLSLTAAADVYFEYGFASGGPYPYSTSHQTLHAIGAFNYVVAHLLTKTTYYFRAVAEEGVAIAYGLEKSFTTPDAVIVPSTSLRAMGHVQVQLVRQPNVI